MASKMGLGILENEYTDNTQIASTIIPNTEIDSEGDSSATTNLRERRSPDSLAIANAVELSSDECSDTQSTCSFQTSKSIIEIGAENRGTDSILTCPEIETLADPNSPTIEHYAFSDTDSSYEPSIFSPKASRDESWDFVYASLPPAYPNQFTTPKPVIIKAVLDLGPLFNDEDTCICFTTELQKFHLYNDDDTCLQCKLLGLRCSLAMTIYCAQPRAKSTCCDRCQRKDNLCIKRALEWDSEYKADKCWAEGVEKAVVIEKAAEIIEARLRRERFALPWVMSGIRRKHLLKLWRHDEAGGKVEV
jgi:hypothetical protein